MSLVLPQNPSRIFLGGWHPVSGKPPWVKGTGSTAAIDPGVQKLKARAVPATRIAELAAAFEQLQGLEIDDPRDLDASSLAALATLPHLRWLQIKRTDLPGSVAAALGQCTALRFLELTASPGQSTFDDAALAELSPLTELEVVILHGLTLDGKGLKALKGMRRLHTLAVTACRARPDLKPLAGLPIHTLILDSTSDIQSHRSKGRVSDAAVAQAAGLPELRHLSLRYAPKVTAKGLAGLANHPTLERLGLGHSQKVASVEAMQAIAAMPALRSVDLGGLLNVRGDQLAALAQSGSLRALRVDVRGLQPGDLAHLAALSGLEHLLLEHTLPRGAAAPISADDLRALADLPLSTLQLPASLPVDADMATAIAHTGARHIILERPMLAAIALEDLAPLADNPHLQTLVTPHRQAAAVAEALGCTVLPSVPYQSDDATQPLQKGILLG